MKSSLNRLSENPYIFLPGWGFSANIWREFGQNFKQADYLEIQQICPDQMVSYLSKTIPDDATVIAWSLSGLYTLQLLEQVKKQIKHLYLVACTPYFSEASYWIGHAPSFRAQFIQKYQQHPSILAKKFIQWNAYPSRLKSHWQKLNEYCQLKEHHEFELMHLETLFNLDMRKTASRYKDKITFILGNQDSVLPQKTSEQLAHHGFDVRTIQNAGHTPFLTHLEACLAHIGSTHENQ